MPERVRKLAMVTNLGVMRAVSPDACVRLTDKALVIAPDEAWRLCDLEGPGRIGRIRFVTPLLGHRSVLHDGFRAFDDYIARTRGWLFLCGHVHVRREVEIGQTRCVSVFGAQVIEL